jgi:hypothetical protein
LNKDAPLRRAVQRHGGHCRCADSVRAASLLRADMIFGKDNPNADFLTRRSRHLRHGAKRKIADFSSVAKTAPGSVRSRSVRSEAPGQAKAKGASTKQKRAGRPARSAPNSTPEALTYQRSFNHLSCRHWRSMLNRSSLLLSNVMSRDHRSGSVADEAIPNSSPGLWITGIVIA